MLLPVYNNELDQIKPQF